MTWSKNDWSLKSLSLANLLDCIEINAKTHTHTICVVGKHPYYPAQMFLTANLGVQLSCAMPIISNQILQILSLNTAVCIFAMIQAINPWASHQFWTAMWCGNTDDMRTKNGIIWKTHIRLGWTIYQSSRGSTRRTWTQPNPTSRCLASRALALSMAEKMDTLNRRRVIRVCMHMGI